MSNPEQSRDASTVNRITERVVDLSARLLFVERVFAKMSELDPKFADLFSAAGHAVVLEKFENAALIHDEHKDRLSEVSAPEFILDAKEAQFILLPEAMKHVASQSNSEWAAEFIAGSSRREQYLLHHAAIGWDDCLTDNALALALGTIQPHIIHED